MQKKSKYLKITFKMVLMKFLAMHITNKKRSYDIYIYTVGNAQNIFIEHDPEKKTILTHTMYCWLFLQI